MTMYAAPEARTLEYVLPGYVSVAAAAAGVVDVAVSAVVPGHIAVV